MNAKKYLQQAYRLNELIEADLQELEHLKLRSTAIKVTDVSEERVQSSGSSDRIGDIIVKIIDMQNSINDEIDQYIDVKKDIRTKIKQIDVRDERLILHLRYLRFLTWGQIAVKLNFTFQWVHVLHKRSLKKVEEFLNS